MAGKYRSLGTGFDRKFRNDLNANFDDVDTDIKAVQTDVNTKNSARISDIEALDTRVDNIVASAGTSNTEIVDARDGEPVLNDRFDKIENVVISIEKFPIQTPEVDATGRLGRASDYVLSKGGGKVLLTAGTFIASYYKVKNKVLLVGQGSGTILKQANNVNTDFITLDNDQVRHAGVSNLIVDGNKQNNTTGRGIFFSAPTYALDSNQYYADNFLIVDNVEIRNCAGDGFHTDTNIREGQFNKIFSYRNNGDGFRLGGSDCYFSNITAYWNVGTGVKITGANHKLSMMKAFGNDYVGFWFNACKRIIAANLEAQENKNHGFMIGAAIGISLSNVLADSNGYGSPSQPNNFNGFHIYDSSNIKIDGHATDFHKADTGSGGTQCYGVRIDNVTTNYDINVRIDNQSYGEYIVSSTSQGTLVVNGKNIAQEDSTYNAKQVRALSKLMKKMNNNEAIVGVCQGDSLTNGQDDESADKRVYTADTTYVTGGSTDTSIGSSTYPEVLQASLGESGKPITIIKRGYNGDTAALSYNRWTTNPNADFHIIQLGTNDAWLQSDVLINIDNYSKLIKRIIDWGSAVIIFTPPRKWDYSKNQGAYVSMLKELGQRFSIPVIDTTLFLEGYPKDEVFQTDSVHLKGKGYYIMGAKAASVLTGITTLTEPFKVKSHRHLIPDFNYNHLSTKGTVTFNSNVDSPFSAGTTSSNGIVAIIGGSSQLNLGFYADEDDLLLIPQFKGTNGQCSIQLNYRADQPYPMSTLVDGKTNKVGQTRPPHSINYAYGITKITDYRYMDIANINVDAIRVTSRGYNSIQVKNALATGDVYFYGFFVISMTEYLINRLIKQAGTGLSIGDSTYATLKLLGQQITVGGLLAPDTSTGEKDIGAYNAKFQKAFLNGFVSTGAFTTAGRPTYTDYQPGAMLFDMTLNKPIWRNAANNGFVDANGNQI